MKIKYIFFSVLIFILSWINVLALTNNYDYYIDTYNIDIKVLKNNSYDIRESIDVYFNSNKHGIYRRIPLKNNIKRLDGTTSNNIVKISNLNISEKYSKKIKNNYYEIVIGDANILVNGLHNYVIEYNYAIGKDPLKDEDEFYFNIIGNEWETYIKKVNFTIEMPDSFDESLLGFSLGSTNSNIEYEVNGNVITGTATNLSAYESLTVRLSLPEGYFSEAKNIFDTNMIISFVIPVILLLIGIFIYYNKCHKNLVVPIEVYPPNRLSSLEIAFLYKGRVNDKDIISLLIYLANEKYIKIIEEKDNTKIVKLRDYEKDDVTIKEFMRGLFVYGNEMTISDLQYSFYRVLKIIRVITNSRENRMRIITEETKFYKVMLGILAILCIIFPVYFQIRYFAYSPFFTVLTLCSSLVIFIPIYQSLKVMPAFWKFVFIVFMFAMGGALIYVLCINYVVAPGLFLLNMIIGALCMVILLLINHDFLCRTDYGNEMLGKILGFKKYLETVEKEELNNNVLKNPNYFYDILPYAYVLGISDIWINKFEDIILKPTYWYESKEGFNLAFFNQHINSTMKDLSKKPVFLTTSVRTGSGDGSSFGSSGFGGGFSSGGGISGGGSGGGGGGAW